MIKKQSKHMFLYRTHSRHIQFFFQTGPKPKVCLFNPPRSCQHCRRGSSGHEPVMLMPAMQWLFPPHCIAADMDEISISFWIQSAPDGHPGFYQNEGPQMTLAFGVDFHINLPGREPGTPQLSVRPDNFQNL